MGTIAKEVSHGIDSAALRQPAAQVEAYLAAFLDKRPLPANLIQAIQYSLLGGGKRLRPILTVRCAEAVGGSADDTMAAAAAIEMVHCFSLVHDDLPAMDDDDLRRGRPTLHRHAGEAMAILAGDAMLALAFELVAQRVEPAERTARIIAELSGATNDMIAGQVYDTLPDFPADTKDMDRLATTHRHKTGALIRCACRMGAICGGASDDQLVAVTRYGEAIGLMFQVVDDLLDVTQTTDQLGKAANKDADRGKLTYPGLMGVDESRGQAQQLRTAAVEAIESLGRPAQPLRDLCDYMALRTC